MWIFSSPQNYIQMIDKIAKSTFVISLFLLYFCTCVSNEFNSFMKKISFDVEYELIGLKLNLAMLYLPLLIGIAEHMFKIHNKISDLLGIRKKYDKNIIAMKILKECKIKIPEDLSEENVKVILSIGFYKYVSSTCPIIDRHYIDLALNEWCWYWITLDTLCLFMFTSILFLIFKWSWANLIVIIIICLFMLLLLKFILKQAEKYTNDEIKEIFSNCSRKKQIRKDLKRALYH